MFEAGPRSVVEMTGGNATVKGTLTLTDESPTTPNVTTPLTGAPDASHAQPASRVLGSVILSDVEPAGSVWRGKKKAPELGAPMAQRPVAPQPVQIATFMMPWGER